MRGEPSGWLRRRGDWNRIASVVRRIAGMPDYQAHIEHLRRCHPGSPVPTEREFFEQFVQARYGGGATRCC
jgi:uncharacterized short protein YbdD (DUF466 family)